jgi:hypothetical protein
MVEDLAMLGPACKPVGPTCAAGVFNSAPASRRASIAALD